MLVIIAASLTGCGVSSVSDLAASTSQKLGTVSEPTFAPVAETAIPPVSPSAPQKTGAGGLSGSALKAAEAATAVATPGAAGYKIGPRDVLDISVFKVAELSKTVQVTESGTINYPLVGEITASGHTARQVEQTLTKSLGDKYLQKPVVTVLVKEYNSQRITIEGAVKKPGVYPVQGGMSLLEALAHAQGLEASSDDSVLVFRTVTGKRSAARFEISSIRNGSTPDPQLQAGDVVVAGNSALKEGFNNLLKVLPLASFLLL